MEAERVSQTERRPEIAALTRRRQPLYVIASPRSRVGRTLLARVLTEYILSMDRRAMAFDVNPEDRSLSRHLPLNALPASISDTRGQVALFDRLIVNDGAVKIVDLAGDQYQAFFDVLHHVGFNAEARRRAIDIVVLFIIGDDRRTESAYRKLLLRREHYTIVPVENPAVANPPPADWAPLNHASPPLVIPAIPAKLGNIGERPDLSFADVLKRQGVFPQDLSGWVGTMFLAFRDMEMRLERHDIAAAFRNDQHRQ